MRSVLIVDDNDILAMFARDWFVNQRFEARVTHSAPSALQIVRDGFVPNVLFTDIVMPGAFDGFALAQQVRELYPEMHILLTTGWALPEYSPFEVLVKPYQLSTLKPWIDRQFPET